MLAYMMSPDIIQPKYIAVIHIHYEKVLFLRPAHAYTDVRHIHTSHVGITHTRIHVLAHLGCRLSSESQKLRLFAN